MASAQPFDVEIFLLCHNRLNYLREALDSIRSQVGARIRCIISDNSSVDDVENWFHEQDLHQIEYRRRVPWLAVMDHFNVILSEVTAPYFMMFHDDDVLLPHAVAHLLSVAKMHPRAAALAGNAEIIYGQKETERKFQLMTKERVVSDAEEVIRAYLLPRSSHPPFPGYLYRRDLTTGVRFNAEEGGKYSDLTFLARLVANGPLVWSPEVTMRYRRHLGNDSGKMDLDSILRLADYISSRGWIQQNEFELRHFVHWHELIHLRDSPWTAREWRMLPIVSGFFLSHPSILARHFLKKAKLI